MEELHVVEVHFLHISPPPKKKTKKLSDGLIVKSVPLTFSLLKQTTKHVASISPHGSRSDGAIGKEMAGYSCSTTP